MNTSDLLFHAGKDPGYAFDIFLDLPESQNSEDGRTAGFNISEQIAVKTMAVSTIRYEPKSNFTSPSLYFLPNAATNCSMTITHGSTGNIGCNVYLIYADGCSLVKALDLASLLLAFFDFTITPNSAGIYIAYSLN